MTATLSSPAAEPSASLRSSPPPTASPPVVAGALAPADGDQPQPVVTLDEEGSAPSTLPVVVNVNRLLVEHSGAPRSRVRPAVGVPSLLESGRRVKAAHPLVTSRPPTRRDRKQRAQTSVVDDDPDRAFIAVLFSDIVGSTQRVARLGDRRWRDLLDRHDELVRAEFARYRGREIHPTGDGFVVAFDCPSRAIRCGIALHRAVGALGLEIRIGVHAGECYVGSDGASGITIHIGARVADLAGANEIFVTSTVRDLVAGSGLEFRSVGRRRLKGVPGTCLVLAVDVTEPPPEFARPFSTGTHAT